MTYKFTKQQYQEIFDIQNHYFPDNILELGTNGKSFQDSLSKELNYFISQNSLENETMALANPYTRELVKDNLVKNEW